MSKYLMMGSLAFGIALTIFTWLSIQEDDQANSKRFTPVVQQLEAETGQLAEATSTNSLQAASVTKPDNTSPITEEMVEQVEVALMHFEELSQYPPSSQPILSEDHVHAFVNASLPQTSLPFPFEGLEKPIQVTIELDQNNYFLGDPIQAKIKVNDTPAGATVSIRSSLMSLEGETLAEGGYQEAKEDATYIIFDSQAFPSERWPMEMNFAAQIDVNGHGIFMTAPFKINSESATLDSVGFSEVVSENLVIPLNLDVKLAGYYFVAGILYSANSKQPLIHLEAEGRLSEGLGVLKLQAHIQALKKGGDEGPYYLDKLRIERWSDDVMPRDIAGKVDQSEYRVEGYSFSDYEDKPYLDPLAEERKRLLQGLSSRL